MSAQLRPMTLGEILDRTFLIYRTRFGVFIAIATMQGLLWTMMSLGSRVWFLKHPLLGPKFALSMSLPFLLWSVLLSMVSGVINLFFRPAFLQTTNLWLRSSAPSIGESLKATTAYFKRAIALNFFEIAVVHLVPGSFFILGAMAILRSFGARSGYNPAGFYTSFAVFCLLAIAVCAFFVLGISLSLTFPSLLFENLSWFDAVKRSLNLVRGSRWRIFCAYSGLAVAARAGTWTAQWVAFFLFQALPISRGTLLHLPFYQYGYAFSSAVVVILIGPIYPIALTLIYYDQRIRREGFDIEWSMRAAGLTVPPTPSSGEAIPASAVTASGSPVEESPI